MSYQILYDKQFIKVGEGLFVPMVYWGSNNCTETSTTGKERRERSWSVFKLTGKWFDTKENFLQACDEEKVEIIKRNEESNEGYIKDGRGEWCTEYSDEKFGYFTGIQTNGSTHNSTFGQYKGIFSTGCNKALTVEQLRDERIIVRVSSYLYKGNYEEIGKEKSGGYPKTGEELITMLNDLEEYYKGTDVSIHVSLSGADEYRMKAVRRRYFPRKTRWERNIVDVEKYWTIVVDGVYFSRKTRYGYKYSPNYPCVKYATEKKVNSRVKTLNKNSSYKFSTELINERARIRE